MNCAICGKPAVGTVTAIQDHKYLYEKLPFCKDCLQLTISERQDRLKEPLVEAIKQVTYARD